MSGEVGMSCGRQAGERTEREAGTRSYSQSWWELGFYSFLKNKKLFGGPTELVGS